MRVRFQGPSPISRLLSVRHPIVILVTPPSAHLHAHTHLHTHIHTYSHTHIYTDIHMHMHVHMHMHMHMHNNIHARGTCTNTRNTHAAMTPLVSL